MTDRNDLAFNSTRVGFFGEHDTRYEAENFPLTKREYFASLCLQGMMSENPTMGLETNILATCAVQFSDALIEALNK